VKEKIGAEKGPLSRWAVWLATIFGLAFGAVLAWVFLRWLAQ
jgi:hypothetical protein